MPERTFIVKVTDGANLQAGLELFKTQPAPQGIDQNTWVESISVRQQKALGVWLAIQNKTVIGHAMAEKPGVDHEYWPMCEDAEVKTAWKNGTLIELGGLLVHQLYRGQGVASALTIARIRDLREKGILVTSIWETNLASKNLHKNATLLDITPTERGSIGRYKITHKDAL